MSTSAEMRQRMAAIRASGLFDDREYEYRAEAALRNQDPVFHYLTAGEARGGRPSRRFDPVYYKNLYGIKGDSPLIHYILFGRERGLRPLPISTELTFTQGRFRMGFRRSVLIAPQGAEWSEAVLRLLEGLRAFLDVVVVIMDAAPPRDPRFEAAAAALVFPAAPLPAGWDDEVAESACLAADILALYAPGSAICFGRRGAHLAMRFNARFIPIVTLVAEDAAKKSFFRDIDLFCSSAAVLFASDDIHANYLRRHPWLPSRRTAVTPLLSAAAPDVAFSSKALATEIATCERLLTEIKSKHARIEENATILQALASNIPQPRDFARVLRANCASGALATGGTPEYPIPRLLIGFDRRGYAKARQLRGGNPVIEYLLEGRFDAFLRPVIRPGETIAPPGGLRAALHGHYYYTDVLDEMLQALARNRHPVDLFLSTDTEAKAKDLAARCAALGRQADIRVLPNRGRDLGPFLTGFRDLFEAGYDIIGHVHGKKTPQLRNGAGDTWRRFLLENTIGGEHATADAVLAALAAHPDVGIVFPETRNTLNWDRNIPCATPLARAMNIPEALEVPSFDYPAGSFFWCRPAALAPLLALKLDWSDYPEEPLVDEDATILHAIERLLPFACEAAGYGYLTTFAPRTRP